MNIRTIIKIELLFFGFIFGICGTIGILNRPSISVDIINPVQGYLTSNVEKFQRGKGNDVYLLNLNHDPTTYLIDGIAKSAIRDLKTFENSLQKGAFVELGIIKMPNNWTKEAKWNN